MTAYDSTIDWDRYWSEADEGDRTDANPSAKLVAEPLLAFLEETGAPASYADVGCGPGGAVFAVAEEYPEAAVVGYDAAEPVLAENRERANEGDVENVAFERAALPAFDPDREFDVVSSFFTLCYVADVERAIRNLYDAVAPGSLRRTVRTHGRGREPPVLRAGPRGAGNLAPERLLGRRGRRAVRRPPVRTAGVRPEVTGTRRDRSVARRFRSAEDISNAPKAVDQQIETVRIRRGGMEITGLKPFVHPEGNCFVKVETDEGLYGIGEAGLRRRGPAVAEVVREFEQDLSGSDPARIEHLWQVMFRGGFFPGGVVQSAAVSAVDIALWDLKGKALGVPVYDLLGGRTREKVPCYPHVGGERVEDLVEDCKAHVDDGWQFVRWGLGDPAGGEVFEPDRAVRDGIERVRAVREACGEDIGICVDVHTRLDPSSAVEFCRGVEEYSPFFIEDPLRSENVAKLRTVREKTSVPIAVGEQFDSKWAFREAIEEDLLDYARVDLCLAGGLTEARKIAGACETHYVELAPHNPLGPVSTAAGLHLCLSSPLVGVQELSRPPTSTMTDVFPTQVPFENGHLLPPEEPGLGVTFDESAFAALPEYEPGDGVGYRREDGSYTNW